MQTWLIFLQICYAVNPYSNIFEICSGQTGFPRECKEVQN